MVILFGISWPVNIIKSLRSKTAKGKSILFLAFIWLGYVFGIAGKIIGGNITYVFIFYIINITMVTFDGVLYFINRRRDKLSQISDK
ncbi:MAG: hypothetical protein KBS59_05640 [Clostridiales bacterium]|nr:hypothetical protein [Clostridiales bacterium]